MPDRHHSPVAEAAGSLLGTLFGYIIVILIVTAIQAIIMNMLIWATIIVGGIILSGILLTLFGIGVRVITYLVSIYCPDQATIMAVTASLLFFGFLCCLLYALVQEKSILGMFFRWLAWKMWGLAFNEEGGVMLLNGSPLYQSLYPAESHTRQIESATLSTTKRKLITYETPAREVYVVSSRLMVIDISSSKIPRAPKIRPYQHWAIEISGRYYELHRGILKACHVSTHETTVESKRIIVRRERLGYTHCSDQDLRRIALAIGAEFKLYNIIWSNCQTFVQRFRRAIECECHERAPMPPRSAEHIADYIKSFALLVTAASSFAAHDIIGRWPTVVCMAAVAYVIWHENETRKAKARVENEAYVVKNTAMQMAEHEHRKASARKVLIDALYLLDQT